MGKVFTKEEIKERKIPKSKDFEEAVKFVEETISSSKIIEGGLIFGSMTVLPKGQVNCRSDFDLLILCDSNSSHMAIDSELKKLLSFFNKRNIPIDLVIVYDSLPRTDVHQIKPILIPHLSYCANKFGFIKKNPLDFIQFKPDPVKDFNDYVKHKMRLESGFYKMDFMDERELCRFLQKILEAPFHIARNFLNCCGKGIKAHEKSRNEVQSLYSSLVDAGSFMLNDCRVINDRYTEYVNECLVGNNKKLHFNIMADLELFAIESIKFIKLNARLASNYFW